MNWGKPIPIDKQGTAMTNFPAPFKAQARNSNTNIILSSLITLTDNTTQVEVGTSGAQGVVIRWIPSTETAGVSPFGSVISSGVGANFDHYVPANTLRTFVIPKEGVGTSSIVGANIMNGLFNRMAVNAAGGASSVLLAEF